MQFTARYADGRTALRHDVTIYVGSDAVSIVDANGTVLDRWPFRGLRLAEEVYVGQPARLIHADKPDANLLIEEPDAVRLVCKRIPGLGGRYLGGLRTGQRLLLWTGALIAVVTLVVVTVPQLAGASARFVPKPWAQALGSAVVESMAPNTCEGSDAMRALDSLVERLTSGRDNPYPIKIRVARDDTVNALAAPGGHVVILSGLIEQAESGDELAAVLAHEVAHAELQHPLRGILRAAGLGLVASAFFGDLSGLGSIAADLGQHAMMMSYTRDDERAADRIAVEMLNGADLRSVGFVRFFERLRDANGSPSEDPDSTIYQLFASHPMHADRIRLIKDLGTGTQPAFTGEEWAAIKGVCKR